MEPLVSVIVPVYNVLPYLREALDSVINQTYKNLEILIVDDGSTDGSGDVCDEYLSDPRVVVIHQENKGLSGARNTGLDRMTGEYVAFLDSDDAYHPDTIQCMINGMTQNEAEISICGYSTCITNSHMTFMKSQKHRSLTFIKEQLLSSSEALNLLISGKCGWYAWNKIYLRKIWETIRFPEGDNYEDMRVMCKIVNQCQNIVIVPNVCVFYRQRRKSITNSVTEKNIRDYIIAIESIENYAAKNIPVIFSHDTLSFFKERYARALSERYARFLFASEKPNIKITIREDIVFRWKELKKEHLQISSRIIRFLFFYMPILIIPAGSCWLFGKHIMKNLSRA